MALEGTHIRLAIDLKGKYKVQDLEKYIVGTIYPDSRYITGIDRELTHNNNLIKLEFAKDDFRKGWQLHLICDNLQNELRRKLLPELSSESREEDFIFASAMKTVQDMNDIKQFYLQKYLKFLDYVYNPNGEELRKIKEYHKIILNLYRGKKETSVEDNYNMWRGLGVEKYKCQRIKQKTEEVLKNQELVKRIHFIYREMIKALLK